MYGSDKIEVSRLDLENGEVDMDKILYFIIMWVTAILFIIIGIYVMNRKKPMWLWTGSQIPKSKIKDVKAYNRAVGKMYLIFSIL